MSDAQDPPKTNETSSTEEKIAMPQDPPQPLPTRTVGHAAEQDEQKTLEEASKKTSRLQWDEENLISNAQEMERAGPRMKIDEPKTPYVQGSETGSSTSGSAQQSPPESPSFIPGERLVGFHSLEQSMRGDQVVTTPSDGASSAGSSHKCVHISDDLAASSGGSSPRAKEQFAARRRAHYRNEALLGQFRDGDDSDDSGENVPNGSHQGGPRQNGHMEDATNGNADVDDADGDSDEQQTRDLTNVPQ